MPEPKTSSPLPHSPRTKKAARTEDVDSEAADAGGRNKNKKRSMRRNMKKFLLLLSTEYDVIFHNSGGIGIDNGRWLYFFWWWRLLWYQPWEQECFWHKGENGDWWQEEEKVDDRGGGKVEERETWHQDSESLEDTSLLQEVAKQLLQITPARMKTTWLIWHLSVPLLILSEEYDRRAKHSGRELMRNSVYCNRERVGGRVSQKATFTIGPKNQLIKA